MNSPKHGQQAALAILTDGPGQQKHRLRAALPRNALLLAQFLQTEGFSRLGAARCPKTKADYCDQARGCPSWTHASQDVSTDIHTVRTRCRNTLSQLILMGSSLGRYVTPLPPLHLHGLPK